MNPKPSGAPPVLLLIDSDPLVRIAAGDILMDAGYRVIAEASADHAMVILKMRPDVQAVVTDVSVPTLLDGCRLVEMADASCPGIGFVITLADRCEGYCELPKNARGLTKPYSPSELLEAVEAVLALRSKPELVAIGLASA